ncbi:MAG: Leucine-tRNA ligase [Candidatus Nomurabacteria bacterium GW2011_GWE2_36_115]|nr:MAG: Leucine-tRNA ligase [Candidatus Nomurabacteria bacterium GW2011_GWE2_36_115]
MKNYDHRKIEKKWQGTWEKSKIYEAKTGGKGKPFYGLIEFPYPSGAGLHVGHIRSNTAMDIITRKRY